METARCYRMDSVITNCERNNREHKTDEISTKRLIVRRGQRFILTFHTSISPDALEFTVQTGPAPSEASGTKCVFGINQRSSAKKSWEANVIDNTSACNVAITSPADASIGKYDLSVKNKFDMTKELCTESFVVLFNPWCAEDWVYLPSEPERQEYVMNEEGLIYTGSQHHISALEWDFGQFEDDIIDICLKLLDVNPKCLRNAGEDFSARCNPIYVGRVISAMVNCNGDKGILMGNWSESYAGGIAPTYWNSSPDILRRWMRQGCTPVKYGQCWVFAGVMCTVMRCLGIPCRVVTNFESGHDTDGNLIIDEYLSENGVRARESPDSIWNFHVWVEGWMRRPDLSADSFYDGWQVLDPTPQELSEGTHCCGPAPVKAVLEGHTNLKYDLPFVFAEVNADRVTWLVAADGSKRSVMADSASIGRNISTKAVGSYCRSNISSDYKYPEGSAREEEVFNEASRRGNKHIQQQPSTVQGRQKIGMRIDLCGKPINGTDIDLTLVLKNDVPRPRSLEIHTNAQAMFYNGMLSTDICTEVKQVQLPPNREQRIPIQIPYSKYGEHILGTNNIKVTAVAIDKEDRDSVYLAERNIEPENPSLTISVLGEPMQYQDLTAKIVFRNTTDVTLRNIVISLIGSGLLRCSSENRIAYLGPRGKIEVEVPFKPYRPGPKMLMADFDCDLFRDVKASCRFEVRPLITCSNAQKLGSAI